MSSQVFVGIDVAKAQWDIALRPTGERWAVTHDDAGIATLVAQLQTVPPTLMVLEATGLSAGRGRRSGGGGPAPRGGQSSPGP